MPGLVVYSSNKHIDNDIFQQMTGALHHREFYRKDEYLSDTLAIARVHLNVFNRRPQPVCNENQSILVFLDGKIVDYQTGCQELETRGYRFTEKDDPEYCLHAYEEYGIDFVRHLNGSFSLVIVDTNIDTLFIVSDRFGSRPLYWCSNRNDILCCSEVKAILPHSKNGWSLNATAVAEWFAYGQLLGDKTFIETVHVFPPGSIGTVNRGTLQVEKYWQLKYHPDYQKTEKEFVNELSSALEDAVRVRLNDGIHYSVALSGGLDSRVVAKAVAANKPQKCAFVSFGQERCNEVSIAKKVADTLNTEFHPLTISPQTILENAPEIAYYSDGMDYIGVGFILSTNSYLREQNIQGLFDGFAMGILLGAGFLSEQVTQMTTKDELISYLLTTYRLFRDDELKQLFSEDFYREIQTAYKDALASEINRIDETNLCNLCDTFTLLNRARRFGMMGSVLCRVDVEHCIPTLDNNFLEVIFSIPPELRINYRIYREFLLEYAPELCKIPYNQTMVPPEKPLYLWKMGRIFEFGKEYTRNQLFNLSKGKINLPNPRKYVDFNRWMKSEEWQSYFTNLLLDTPRKSHRYVSTEYIKTLLSDHERGTRDNSHKLLQIASFELFLREFSEELSAGDAGV